MTHVHNRTVLVGDINVFYRESGKADAPVLLLLHGFPTSSHMFRDLIPHLSSRFRVIAPDLPGFGQTPLLRRPGTDLAFGVKEIQGAPKAPTFEYTFDSLAKVMGGFTESLGLSRYALYMFDYGSPVGMRLALAHPERVTAIISRRYSVL